MELDENIRGDQLQTKVDKMDENIRSATCISDAVFDKYLLYILPICLDHDQDDSYGIPDICPRHHRQCRCRNSGWCQKILN